MQPGKRAGEVAEYFLRELGDLSARHPVLGWIDARGLHIGLELVRDREICEPAGEQAVWMLDFCVAGFVWEKGGYCYHQARHGQVS